MASPASLAGSKEDSLEERRITSTGTRLSVAGAVGVVGVVLMGVLAGWRFAALVGWDVMAVVFVSWTWTTIWNRDAAQTERLSVREEPARALSDLLLVVASLASLIGVGFVLVAGSNSRGVEKALLVTLAITTVVVSWAVVHLTYTLRYARLFYSDRGGLNFHQRGPGQPQYSDFAYLAFTIGMTFQVSDTEVNTVVMRRTILRHALLAYLFGVVIIAIMINLVAGLSK